MLFKKSFFIVLSLLSLSSCSSDEEVVLLGDRESVFKSEKITPSLSSSLVSVPVASNPDTWMQFGLSPSHVLPMLEFKLESLEKDKLLGAFSFSAPPVVVDSILYTQTTEGSVLAYDLKSESLIWKDDRVSLSKKSPKFGGLAFENDVLYASFGTGDLIAFDAKTGSVLWNVFVGSPVFGAPTVLDGKVFVQTKTNFVPTYRAKDGVLVGSAQGIENNRPVLKGNTPTVTKTLLLAGQTTGDIFALSHFGDLKWRQKLFSPTAKRTAGLIKDIVAPLVLEGNSVIATGLGGETSEYILDTGKVRWSAPVGSSFAPLVSNNTVFILSESSSLVALNRENGQIRWEKSLSSPEKTCSFPLFLNQKIGVFCSDNSLVLIEPHTGDISSQTDLGLFPDTSPVFAQNTFFILSNHALYKLINKGD